MLATTQVITYTQCNNINRIEVRLAGTLFDFSLYERIRFFVRNQSDFSLQLIDSVDNAGTIRVIGPGILDLLFTEALEPGRYYAGIKVFVNEDDAAGQMLFHDQERLLEFSVYQGVPLSA